MGPYKSKFRRIFKQYLKLVNAEIASPMMVLDAACAKGKFVHLFDNDFYMGVDIDFESIRYLRARYPHRHKFFVIDLIEDSYPKNFDYSGRDVKVESSEGRFDLVITTHTLSHIPLENHVNVISKLIDSMKINGYLILHTNSKNIETISFLKERLMILQEKSYRGRISHFMEKNFTDNFHMSLLGRVLNKTLSFVDMGSSDIIFLCKRSSV